MREDLKCYYVDINNVFIKATLIKDIYLILPESVNIIIKKVFKINKSLYRLK